MNRLICLPLQLEFYCVGYPLQGTRVLDTLWCNNWSSVHPLSPRAAARGVCESLDCTQSLSFLVSNWARPSTLLTPVSRAAAHLVLSSLSSTKRKERDCVQSSGSCAFVQYQHIQGFSQFSEGFESILSAVSQTILYYTKPQTNCWFEHQAWKLLGRLPNENTLQQDRWVVSAGVGYVSWNWMTNLERSHRFAVSIRLWKKTVLIAFDWNYCIFLNWCVRTVGLWVKIFTAWKPAVGIIPPKILFNWFP